MQLITNKSHELKAAGISIFFGATVCSVLCGASTANLKRCKFDILIRYYLSAYFFVHATVQLWTLTCSCMWLLQNIFESVCIREVFFFLKLGS